MSALDELPVPPAELQAALDRIPGRPARGARASPRRASRPTTAPSVEQPAALRAATGSRSARWPCPVDRAGCYVPGGRAVYPSTVLMTAVAGPGGRRARGRAGRAARPRDGRVPDVTLAAAALAGVDEVYRIGGAQAIAALAYGTESIAPVDVIVGPGNVYVAVAKREVAREGLVGVPSAFAGPCEVVVVADGTVAGRLRRHRRHRAGRARSRRPGLADHLGRGRGRRGRPTPSPGSWPTSPRRADIEATLAAGGYAVLVDGARAGDGRRQRHRPRAPRADGATTPRRSSPLVRHAGAVFCGPWAPASRRRLPRRAVSHVLPTFGSARFGQALTVDDFPKHVHVVDRRRGRAARGRRATWSPLAEAEGLAAHAEIDPAAAGRRAVTPRRARPRRPAALEGYHSPQVDGAGAAQHQRVARAAAGGVARRARRRAVPRSTGTATPTAPRPSCGPAIAALHGVAARAGVRGQRLERGAADAAASPTAARAGAVATFEPTYALHGHIARITGTEVVEGERRADFTARPRRGPPGAGRAPSRPSRSSARPTTRPAWSSPRRRCGEVLGRRARAASWSTRPTGSSRPWSALDLVDDDRPLVVTRTFSKTWSMAAARLGYLRRPGVARGRARQGRAAVPPRRGQAGRRPPGAATSSTRWRRG